MPVIVALALPGASNHGAEHDKSTGTSRQYWMAGSTGCTGSDWEVLVPVSPVGFHFTDVGSTIQDQTDQNNLTFKLTVGKVTHVIESKLVIGNDAQPFLNCIFLHIESTNTAKRTHEGPLLLHRQIHHCFKPH